MSTQVVQAADYMARFRCLGASCEDTCCGGWTVPVDEPTHRRLKVLAEREPAAERLLTEGIELLPAGPDFARLRFQASGYCCMLEDGLCAIHARLGPEALPDVCMTYPRYFNEVDGELELFGSVSCPEVARLCLLADKSFAPRAMPLEAPPRKLRNRFTTEEPYFRPFAALRSAFAGVLAETLPLPEKLFVLLWFSSKLSRLLYAGCPEVPSQELTAALDALGKPELLQALGANYRALDVTGGLAFSIIERLLDPALASDSAPEPDGEQAGESWARYLELRARVPATAVRRLDECLTRYAINHLHTTPYMLSKNLLAYALDLVVRVAALRCLLCTRLADFSGDAAELDRQIIDVVYKFGRRVEHAGLLGKLSALLEEQQLGTLAHAIGFVSV